MTRSARRAVAALALSGVLLLVLALWGWQRWSEPPAAPATTTGTVPPAAPSTDATPAPAPMVAAAPEPPVPADAVVAAEGIDGLLFSLFGRQAVLSLLQTTEFPRRFVATVDNLAREQAPAALWPLDPAPARFLVIERADGSTVVSPDNGQRYVPLVLLAESVDAQRLADAYRQLLPLLQPAYEDLGYPGRRFHTRMLQVLDHLLATPAAPEPLQVQLTQVRGPVPSTRPWVRYEFVDARLEQASAGQKMLLRVGPVNQRRLHKVLREFRDAITVPAR